MCMKFQCEEEVFRRGFCVTHFGEAMKKREFGNDACLECSDGAAVRGLCRHHYYLARKSGDLENLPRGRSGCSEVGCPDTKFSRGMCRRHYQRWYRGLQKRDLR